MPRIWAFLIATTCVLPVRAAVLREAAGLVQVRTAGGDNWNPAGKLPRPLNEGDGVRSGFNAKAKVELYDGTTVETAGNAHISVEVDGRTHTSVHALFGKATVSANAFGGRVVSVRTPVCVVRARGERVVYRLTVAGGGSTTVEIQDGVAGVEDNRGNSMLLRRGQRVEVDLAGVHEPTAAPTPVQAKSLDFAAMMRRELGFELGRDADYAAAAREARRGERELGRVLQDSDGNRVRVEEYLVRPAANQVNLVVMNGRRSGGLSYFSWNAVFTTVLPVNLEPVMAGVGGGSAASAWTVSTFATTFANERDNLVYRGEGGHQVDLNGNADPLDDIGTGSAFRTIFDRYGVYANGVLKRGFTGVNLQAYSDAVASVNNDPLTGAALAVPLPVVVINASYPDAAAARRTRLESYGNGTTIQRETATLEFAGGVAPRSSLGAFDLNMEERVTFAGRTISVVMPSRAALVTEQVK